MMMKVLFFSHAKTLEEYRQAVRRRAGWFWVAAVLGLVTLCVTLAVMGGQIAELEDTAYLQGVWCGIGSGLTAAGVILVLRTRRLLQNEAALREEMLKEQDERNIAISQKAQSAAAALGLVVLYLALLIFSFINLTVFRTLCCCALVFCLLFLAAKAFYSRKM